MTQLSTTRYQHRALLGQGGMGRVSLVTDTVTGRDVALKEILVAGASEAEFKQEFWWMSRLRHPHLVEVYDFGLTDAGKPFFTMEVVEGAPLDAQLPLEPETARSVLRQLCRALRYIHQQGLVHGDIKPENMRRTPDGGLKLMDFGLMARAGQPAAVRGTLAYMAPEMIRRARVDQRADLYAVGVLAYQLLTGRLPFEGESASELLRAHLDEVPLPPGRFRKELDPAWNKLVMRLLAKEPLKRHQSAAEVLEELGETVEDDAGTLLASPFIGREREREAFEAALAALQAGGAPGVMRVAGARGTGKTRLLEEFALSAQLAEQTVLRGSCQVAGTPYEPFAQMLRQAWPALTHRAPQLLDVHGPALAALVPELVGGSTAAHQLEPREEKLRLQSAVAELLLALVRHGGLVVLLDDWHATDAMSAELLSVLMRRLDGQPVLWVAAAQRFGAEPPSATLEPLSRFEIAQMLGAMLGVEAVPDAFSSQVAELTAGAPYAVEAFLAHLVDHRLLPRERGRWVLAPLPPQALPKSLHDLLNDRLSDLSALGRQVVTLAGVMARPFELELLFRLLPEVQADQLYEELARLEQGQLLIHQRGSYQIAQAHLAEALLAGLPDSEVQALHARVAEALEESEPDGDSGEDGMSVAHVTRLAHHFLAGDRPAKAIVYALRAAQRMAALFANDQAREMLLRGWAIVEALPDAAEALRLEYLSLKGDLHRVASEFDEAGKAYAAALPLAESQARPELVAHVLVGLGLVKQMQSDYEGALEVFNRALPVCRTLSAAREELRCLNSVGRVLYYAGDKAASQATYEIAHARAREVNDLAWAGESLGFLGLLHVSAEPVPGESSTVAQGLEYLRQAIALKEAVGDKRGLNDSHMLLGNAQLALGDLAAAEASFRANQALCQEIGAFEDEIFSYLNLGLVATDRGDALAALEHIRKAITLAEPRKSLLPLGFAACLEGRALLFLGQLETPLSMLEGSLERARELDNRYWELFALVYLIEAQLKLGLWDEAQSSLLEALSAEAATGITEYALQLQLAKATLAMRQGNAEPARQAFEEALSRAEAREARMIEAQACLGLAELALQDGQPELARPWAERAVTVARRADAQAIVCEGLFLQGRLAEAAGDTTGAERLFQQTQELAERQTALDLLARALYRRASLQFPAPQAGKLLKRAQELMVQQASGLSPGCQEAFLASYDRYAVFMGELAGAHAPVPAAEDFSGGEEARQALTQQRVWIDELQSACNLLMKQLDFSQVMARSTDAQFVMNHALALILEITQADRAELLLLDGKRLAVKARKQLTSLKRLDEDWTIYLDVVEEAVSAGELRYLPDTIDQPVGGLDEPRMVLAAPLADDNGRMGAVLVLGHPGEAAQLLKRELDAVKMLLNQLSATLRNIRLQSEWREKTARLEMLYMLSSSVTSTLVMDEVLDLVIKLSLDITKADRGFLLLQNDNGELECRAARYADGPIADLAANESYSQSICRRVLESGEAMCVEDTQDDDLLRQQKSIQDLNLRTVMCVPLKVKQRSLGVLYVDSRVVVNTFTPRDLDLLRSIASQASIAIDNARLYTLATVDGLTGLYFRSHFEQRMREEIQRAQRFGGSLAYMMMDIDHFKKFNDTYGHAVGDEVLRHVAGVIKASVRTDIDIPCRYGGEEMVVLLPETDEAGALILAERIRKAVDEALLDTDEHKGLHVTISIGVAVFPQHATTALNLMEFADQALYQSKRGGRNRVTMYNPGLPGE